MLSNRIIGSAAFLQMPLETQALYFHLVCKADDDGVVEAYSIIKTLGTTGDSLQILVAKNFIYPLNQEAVLYVVNWGEHNKIRPDRLVKSIYRPLLLKTLPALSLEEPKPRIDVKDNSRRLVDSPRTAEVKLSKVKYTPLKEAESPNTTEARNAGDISVLLERTRGQLKEKGII